VSAAPPDADEQRIRREAAAWLVKHDRGLTASEQDEFFQWLSADARHGAWFARHRRGWRRLDGIMAWRPEHSAEPNPDAQARSPDRSAWRRQFAAVAATALILAGGWSIIHRPTDASLDPLAPVANGGYERRVFEDGSVAELNRGAEIEVHFTATERRIALRRGEALFTVTKDPQRPFVVRAHGVDVRAIGTAFNVRVQPSGVEVLVTHGTVQVAGTRYGLPHHAPLPASYSVSHTLQDLPRAGVPIGVPLRARARFGGGTACV